MYKLKNTNQTNICIFLPVSSLSHAPMWNFWSNNIKSDILLIKCHMSYILGSNVVQMLPEVAIYIVYTSYFSRTGHFSMIILRIEYAHTQNLLENTNMQWI